VLETVDFGVEPERHRDKVAIGMEIEVEYAIQERLMNLMHLFPGQRQHLILHPEGRHLLDPPLVITDRNILQVHIGITGPQLRKQIILEDQVVINIILLIDVLGFGVHVLEFRLAVVVVGVVAAGEDEEVLAGGRDYDVPDQVGVQVQGDLVVVLERVADRGDDSLLGLQVLRLREVQHLGCPVVELEHDLVDDGLVLLPDQDDSLVCDDIAQLCHEVEYVLEVAPVGVIIACLILALSVVPATTVGTTTVVHTAHKALPIGVIDHILRDIDLHQLHITDRQYRRLITKAQSLYGVRSAQDLRYDIHHHDELILVER